MDRAGQRGGFGKSELFGCLAGLTFALVFGAMVLLISLFGDCIGDEDCHANDRRNLMIGLVLVATGAALYGAGIRAIALWHGRRKAQGTASWPPIWAILVTLPPTLLMTLAALSVLML